MGNLAISQQALDYMNDSFGFDKIEDEDLRDTLYLVAVNSGHTDPESSRAQDEKVRHIELEREEREKRSWLEKLETTQIPTHLLPEAGELDREYWPLAIKKAEKWFQTTIVQGRVQNLIITGRSGSGKSRIAAEYAYRSMGRRKSVFWLNVEQYRNMLEDGAGSGPLAEQQRHRAIDQRLRAIRADICMIDEIGKSESKLRDGKSLSWIGRMLYEIVEARRGRPTIVTSEWELRSADMIARLTEGLVNRLEENATIINRPPRLSFKQTQVVKNQLGLELSGQSPEKLGEN